MKISGGIKGIKGMAKAFGNLRSEMLQAQKGAVADATLLIHETAIKSIQEVGDGTVGIRYNPKRVVNISKPGDPPNSDTGRLAKSIKFDFKDNGLTGRIGSNLKYAAWLEFGTEHVAPRPWLAPAVSESAKSIGEIFAKHVKGAIEDSEK